MSENAAASAEPQTEFRASNFRDHLAALDAAAESDAPGDSGSGGEEGYDRSPARARMREAPPAKKPTPRAPKSEDVPEPEEWEDDGVPDDPEVADDVETDELSDEDEPNPEEQAAESEEQEQRRGGPTKAELMEMHKAISSPNLPEQLYDRTIRVSDGEHEYDVPVGEMRQGYMRAKAFARGQNEKAEAIRSAQDYVNGLRYNFEVWKHRPDAAVSSIAGIIGMEALDKIVQHRAEQIYTHKHASPEVKRILAEAEQARMIAHQREMELRQMQAANRPDPQAQAAQVEQQLQSHMPSLLAKYGVQHVNEGVLGLVAMHFQAIMRPGMTQQHVPMLLEQAAYNTAQQMREMNHEAWQQQQPQGREAAKMLKQSVKKGGMPPRAMPGPAAKAGSRGERGTRRGGGSPSQFGEMMRRHDEAGGYGRR